MAKPYEVVVPDPAHLVMAVGDYALRGYAVVDRGTWTVRMRRERWFTDGGIDLEPLRSPLPRLVDVAVRAMRRRDVVVIRLAPPAPAPPATPGAATAPPPAPAPPAEPPVEPGPPPPPYGASRRDRG